MTLSTKEVEDHIRNDGAVAWTNLANVLVGGVQSCVDGRDPSAVLGTPGGDAGEYLVSLATIEKLSGKAIADDEVTKAFHRFLAHFGTFYMHTDSHAVGNLAKSLSQDAAFADVKDAKDAEALVRTPGDRAEALLPFLLDPNHVGCGHLKLILLHADAYGVRRGLTEQFLRSVFRAMWAGAAIDYVVLLGGHAEGAVVQVTSGRDAHAFTRVPKVAPCSEGNQMFVNHPVVAEWKRRQMAAFLVESEPLLKGTSPDDFVEAVVNLANQQLGETLGHLAQGLPIYNAQVTEDGTVNVTDPSASQA